MKRVSMVVAAIAVAWSAGVSAQGRNFGGQWVVDAEKTGASAAAGATRSVAGGGGGGRIVAGGAGGGGGVVSGGGGGVISERRSTATTGGGAMVAGGGGGRGGAATGPMVVSIDAAAFTTTLGESATSYKLDGTPTVIESGSRRSTTKAAWQGDRLVIQTTTEVDGARMASTTTTWYLEGEHLVRETVSVTPSGESAPRKTYYKRA